MGRVARVRIAVDSMADIPQDLATELGIAVVPACITFGDETFFEGVNLTRDEFYGRLITTAGLPKTAAPGPGAFADAYARLAAENEQAGVPLDAIVSLHPPAALSGLYNAALSGSQLVEGVRIIVIDCGHLSMSMGWQAIMAARAALAGQPLSDILSLINRVKERAMLVAGLETLEWAARSGRIPRLVAAVGNFLAVKPILLIEGGEISLAERVRTHSRQIERVVERCAAVAPSHEVAVLHARCPDVAHDLADRLAALHPRDKIIVTEIGCILGSYAGPGAYGAAIVRS